MEYNNINKHKLICPMCNRELVYSNDKNVHTWTCICKSWK